MTADDDGPDAADPATELDTRFSEDGAAALSWVEARQLLERAELSWLSTIHRNGRPNVTPVLTVVVDGTVRFCTGAGEQKARNLGDHPEVAVTTGVNVLQGDIDVVVEGTAQRVVDEAELLRIADAYEVKYGPRWRFDVAEAALEGEGGNVALVFEVVPRVAFGFAKGPYGQTRWRFTDR